VAAEEVKFISWEVVAWFRTGAEDCEALGRSHVIMARDKPIIKPINNYITGGRSVPRSRAGIIALFRGM
jgi:hypothetical protein